MHARPPTPLNSADFTKVVMEKVDVIFFDASVEAVVGIFSAVYFDETIKGIVNCPMTSDIPM